MVKKRDNRQINAVAKEFNMGREERKRFGNYIESEKALGYGGTQNERGDFTYEELREKAREFLGLD